MLQYESLRVGDLAAKNRSAENPVPAQSPSEAKASDADREHPAPARTYRLAPGDEIEIAYRFSKAVKHKDYRVRVGDQIGLNLIRTPDYSRTLLVRSDGKVDLPLVGEIVAVGKTLAELKEEILAIYAKQLEEPQIDVYSSSYTTADDELKEALINVNYGISRRMPVRPDGYVSPPLLEDVRAAGRTAVELSQAIETLYAEQGFDNVDVTVTLTAARSSLAYLLGEIPTQGPLHLRGPIDAWRAIAEAGGFGPDADRRHVVVARTTEDEEKRFVINFDTWRANRDRGENVMIEPGDIIYVPKASKRYIYIAGEVAKPGRVDADYDSEITVSQAVAMGGGVTTWGKRRQALLLKGTSTEKPVIVAVDLKAIYDPDKISKWRSDPFQLYDPLVEPGDIVYVPSSPVGDLNRFARQWFRDGIWTIIPFTTTFQYQRGDLNVGE